MNVQDLVVTKYIDSSSPKRMLACCSGKHFSYALLTVRKSGGTSGGADRLTENINLNFAKVTVEYVPQRADGNAATMIPFGWNIAANHEA